VKIAIFGLGIVRADIADSTDARRAAAGVEAAHV
jgi:hypothetical protein